MWIYVPQTKSTRSGSSRELALPHAAVVASAPMFDVIATQLSAAAEKITHLRRFL
jgi:hypothetical protein